GDTKGRETAALKQKLEELQPACITDFHNFMYPTEVFAPTVYSPGKLQEQEKSLALAIQSAWRGAGLHFRDRAPRPYPKPTERYYEDAWFHGLGAQCLIIEFNGGMLATEGAEYEPDPNQRSLTRRESMESVYLAAKALLEQFATPTK
ncbi:MAG: hypothetical protein ACRD41_08970, partial [Candidatus Acidiferrales bacterium]